MKSGNYNELLDKFYAGKASDGEINILEKEGLLDEQDIFYCEALNSERGQKMEWDFEDFLNEIPEAKVVTIPARRRWMKRMIAAAAVLATILISYIFWPEQYKQKEIVQVPVINKQIDSNNNVNASSALPDNEVKDSVLLSKDVKTHLPQIKNYAVKTRKQSPSKSRKIAVKNKEKTASRDGNFMVVVNGKPITDEADALAIMKESLSMVSRNLTNTVDELKPIGQIKIKL